MLDLSASVTSHATHGQRSSAASFKSGEFGWPGGTDTSTMSVQQVQEQIKYGQTTVGRAPTFPQTYFRYTTHGSSTSGVNRTRRWEVRSGSPRTDASEDFPLFHRQDELVELQSTCLPAGLQWDKGTASIPTYDPLRFIQSPGPVPVDEWTKLANEVQNWSHISADWLDEDACAPADNVVDAAHSFLLRARAACVPLPTASADGDGEIAFIWKAGRVSASASFLPDGHIVGYVSHGNGDHMFKLDAPYAEGLDLGDFFENIRSIY